MFGGNSGCSGIVIYNTKIQGDNAIYGYYIGNEMRFETGTKEAMIALKNASDRECSKRSSITGKLMVKVLLLYIAVTIISFIALPLKFGFAVLLFCIASYIPLLIIIAARGKLYEDLQLHQQFCRNHGCEHAVIQFLTKDSEVTMENLRRTSIYDTECGTAYAGYAVLLALELATLIIVWPGLLAAALIVLGTIIVLVIMILNVKINPFTLLQHKVVSRPGDREYALGLELIKRMKELE